jgi:hypothetical protein
MFKYEIDGKEYIQKPLVWGQAKQLKTVISNVKIVPDFNPVNLLDILGDNVPLFCAVVLCEEGTNLVDKDLDELTIRFENSLDIASSMKVMEDFFVCNPIDLISRSLLGLGQAVGMIMRSPLISMAVIPSTEPSVLSPEETSPKETE